MNSTKDIFNIFLRNLFNTKKELLLFSIIVSA